MGVSFSPRQARGRVPGSAAAPWAARYNSVKKGLRIRIGRRAMGGALLRVERLLHLDEAPGPHSASTISSTWAGVAWACSSSLRCFPIAWRM